jgi:hypothetical protein
MQVVDATTLLEKLSVAQSFIVGQVRHTWFSPIEQREKRW